MLYQLISEKINARIKPTPYYYDADGVKEAYIPSGNESIIAPNHILNELILKGTNQTYDTILTRFRKSDYSFTFFEATFRDKTHTGLTEKDYRSFGLTDTEGYLTNAGVLLADQNVYRHSRIFCTRWNGLDKASDLGEALDDKEISESIVSQLFAAMDFVRANTKRKWRKSGMTRIDSPEYDEEAVREALVNGIIHREYTRLGAEVCLDIYDDRIEVTSPGSMFSGKHIDKTVDRIVASERRNPVIADLFARMKFMKRRGSGLKKITDRTNDLFGDGANHVEFYSDNRYFKVTIFNANYGKNFIVEENDPINDPVNDPENEPVNIKLSKTEKQIIDIIKANPHITYDELVAETSKSKATIKRCISSLKKKQCIERIGSNKTGSWKIVQF